ncbi:MAG: XRE family transcriptional regulator, partial [Eubacteriales bacterium]
SSGIDKVHRFADYCHVPIKAFVADMNSWRSDSVYDVVYARQSLHYLKKEDRHDFIDRYKKLTSVGGVHALEIFVEKPYIDVAPDQEAHVSLWRSGEIFAYYYDWEFLKMEEKIFDCCSSGVPHKHVCNILIARKKQQ